jgi:hypothetical protein
MKVMSVCATELARTVMLGRSRKATSPNRWQLLPHDKEKEMRRNSYDESAKERMETLSRESMFAGCHQQKSLSLTR